MSDEHAHPWLCLGGMLGLALAATAGCFEGRFLAGLPCAEDHDCGPRGLCVDGRCAGVVEGESTGTDGSAPSPGDGEPGGDGEASDGDGDPGGDGEPGEQVPSCSISAQDCRLQTTPGPDGPTTTCAASADYELTPWSDCKCVPHDADDDSSWDSNTCVALSDAAHLDDDEDDCTVYADGSDSCDLDSWCWATGPGEGTCVALCTNENERCGELSDHVCSLTNAGSVSLCLRRCSVDLDTCRDGFACVWNGADFVCAPEGDELPAGEPCAHIEDCEVNEVCVEEVALLGSGCSGARCCAKFCSEDADCEICDQWGCVQPTSCVEFFADPGIDDDASVKACARPMVDLSELSAKDFAISPP